LQSEWKEEMKLREIRLMKRSEPEQMEELRMKFLEQAKKYFGVPYKRKYWPKDGKWIGGQTLLGFIWEIQLFVL
jgi:hypothetical protein